MIPAVIVHGVVHAGKLVHKDGYDVATPLAALKAPNDDYLTTSKAEAKMRLTTARRVSTGDRTIYRLASFLVEMREIKP